VLYDVVGTRGLPVIDRIGGCGCLSSYLYFRWVGSGGRDSSGGSIVVVVVVLVAVVVVVVVAVIIDPEEVLIL